MISLFAASVLSFDLTSVQSTVENVRAARKYFTQSFHLNRRNPRALWGMALSAHALSREQGKGRLEDKAVNDEIHAFARERRS